MALEYGKDSNSSNLEEAYVIDATKAQIAEQVQLERDQIAQGLKRLRDNTRQVRGKGLRLSI